MVERKERKKKGGIGAKQGSFVNQSAQIEEESRNRPTRSHSEQGKWESQATKGKGK